MDVSHILKLVRLLKIASKVACINGIYEKYDVNDNMPLQVLNIFDDIFTGQNL